MLTAGGGPTVVIAHSLGAPCGPTSPRPCLRDLLPSRVALVSPATRPEWSEAAPKFADIYARLALGGTHRDRGPRRGPVSATVPLAEFAAEWGAPCVEIPGSGHLTPADGHGPFPGALAWVLGGPDSAWADAETTRPDALAGH